MILLYTALGAVLGFAVAWFAVRGAFARERDAIKAEFLREHDAKTEALQQVAVLEERARTLKANLDEHISQLAEKESLLNTQGTDNARQGARISELEMELTKERESAVEKLALLSNAREALENSFKALSADALSANNTSFLTLAKQNLQNFQDGAKNDLETRQTAIGELVKPLNDALIKVDQKVQELETKREGAYESVRKELQNLASTSGRLQEETSKLGQALRSPNVRGRWGEIQLERILELAGLTKHFCWTPQETVDGEEKSGRPDGIVSLPNKWRLAIDSKVPYEAFEQAIAAVDPAVRKEKLREHAKAVRGFVDNLSRKTYAQKIQPGPDYVIMLIPGEAFYYAALESDPTLLEYGAEQKVLIVSPVALIGLLRSVYFGWREQELAENAKEITELGKQLYDRLRRFVDHFNDVGRGLQVANNAYEKARKSVSSRLLVTARKFEEYKVSTGDTIPVPVQIEEAHGLNELSDSAEELADSTDPDTSQAS
ncbi:DNA recombination protein RmuC [candidate division KSB1 bacterium]|nr:DNA recombination protein RmuC [candidate division KSB1 bacterium]